jgi:hypothetical protein
MSNKFDTVLTYYKNEVNLKNNEINKLKSIIDSLKSENKKLFNKIELLKFENYKVKELYGTKDTLDSLKSNYNNNKTDNSNTNKSEINNFTIPDSYTKKQIYDLEIFNRKNIEIITKMTNFYNKINNLFNNNRIILKYDGINTNMEQFNKNLNIIESEIMNQYGDGNNYPQNNFVYNENNNFNYNSEKLFKPFNIKNYI